MTKIKYSKQLISFTTVTIISQYLELRKMLRNNLTGAKPSNANTLNGEFLIISSVTLRLIF